MAYTKLLASRREEDDEIDSDEENTYNEEDVHEMRAFMRMFMDLVGIFNDDQSTADIKGPAGLKFYFYFVLVDY